MSSIRDYSLTDQHKSRGNAEVSAEGGGGEFAVLVEKFGGNRDYTASRAHHPRHCAGSAAAQRPQVMNREVDRDRALVFGEQRRDRKRKRGIDHRSDRAAVN